MSLYLSRVSNLRIRYILWHQRRWIWIFKIRVPYFLDFHSHTEGDGISQHISGWENGSLNKETLLLARSIKPRLCNDRQPLLCQIPQYHSLKEVFFFEFLWTPAPRDNIYSIYNIRVSLTNYVKNLIKILSSSSNYATERKPELYRSRFIEKILKSFPLCLCFNDLNYLNKLPIYMTQNKNNTKLCTPK